MTVKTIGPFVVGARPEPLVVTFDDADGVVLADITSYTAKFQYKIKDGVAVTNSAVISSGPLAQVTYTWADADMATAGDYEAIMWIGNGSSYRPPSKKFLYRILAGVGTAPNI